MEYSRQRRKKERWKRIEHEYKQMLKEIRPKKKKKKDREIRIA